MTCPLGIQKCHQTLTFFIRSQKCRSRWHFPVFIYCSLAEDKTVDNNHSSMAWRTWPEGRADSLSPGTLCPGHTRVTAAGEAGWP